MVVLSRRIFVGGYDLSEFHVCERFFGCLLPGLSSSHFSWWNISETNILAHATYLLHVDRTMYSGSPLEVATVVCIFLFQHIRLPLMDIRYPVVDFLVSISPPQSESTAALRKFSFIGFSWSEME